VYTNWGGNEPNNSAQLETFPGEGEDGLEMHNADASWVIGRWNDMPGTAAYDATQFGATAGFIAEYNAPSSVPEPSTLLLLGSGLAGLGGVAWRRHRK
jgi:hypothetical protein